MLGGGSLPNQTAPTWCVVIEAGAGGVDALAAAIRNGEPAVVGRVKQDRLLLDLRTVAPKEDQRLVLALGSVG